MLWVTASSEAKSQLIEKRGRVVLPALIVEGGWEFGGASKRVDIGGIALGGNKKTVTEIFHEEGQGGLSYLVCPFYLFST